MLLFREWYTSFNSSMYRVEVPSSVFIDTLLDLCILQISMFFIYQVQLHKK